MWAGSPINMLVNYNRWGHVELIKVLAQKRLRVLKRSSIHRQSNSLSIHRLQAARSLRSHSRLISLPSNCWRVTLTQESRPINNASCINRLSVRQAFTQLAFPLGSILAAGNVER
jgi:hypothetical protein